MHLEPGQAGGNARSRPRQESDDEDDRDRLWQVDIFALVKELPSGVSPASNLREESAAAVTTTALSPGGGDKAGGASTALSPPGTVRAAGERPRWVLSVQGASEQLEHFAVALQKLVQSRNEEGDQGSGVA